MIKIILKDGKELEVEKGLKVADIAAKLSTSLGKKALGAKINGKVEELNKEINEDCKLEILTFEDEEGRKILRHTASHILAQAIKRLYPEVKLAIGPAIDSGFYYDIDAEFSFTPELLEKVEKIGKTKEEYLAKLEKVGEENMKQIEKIASLRVIDTMWTEHLENMESLRDSVRIRAYGQRDPLVEYKKEAHLLFKEFLEIMEELNGKK